MTNPALIAAHLRTTTLPAVDASGRALAARLGIAWLRLSPMVIDAARLMELVDMPTLAAHLASQRALAAEGRPKAGAGGRSSAVPDPTSDTATEMARIGHNIPPESDESPLPATTGPTNQGERHE